VKRIMVILTVAMVVSTGFAKKHIDLDGYDRTATVVGFKLHDGANYAMRLYTLHTTSGTLEVSLWRTQWSTNYELPVGKAVLYRVDGRGILHILVTKPDGTTKEQTYRVFSRSGDSPEPAPTPALTSTSTTPAPTKHDGIVDAFSDGTFKNGDRFYKVRVHLLESPETAYELMCVVRLANCAKLSVAGRYEFKPMESDDPDGYKDAKSIRVWANGDTAVYYNPNK
jgi:hypothetical protein